MAWLVRLMVQQLSSLQIILWQCTSTALHTASTLLLWVHYKSQVFVTWWVLGEMKRALEKAIADTQQTLSQHQLFTSYVVLGGFIVSMPWKSFAPFISPLLPAWRASIMMVSTYGPQMHLLTDARNLLLAINTTDFNLQAETKDIIAAVGEIKIVTSIL